MLKNDPQMKRSSERGFTLIELIVVTGVLGVLAAIAIPQYASYKSRAVDTQMQSAVKNARTAQEAYYIENQRYTSDVPTLETYGYNDTTTVALVMPTGGGIDYSIDYRLRGCAEGGSFDAFEYSSTGANAGQTVGVNGVSCP